MDGIQLPKPLLADGQNGEPAGWARPASIIEDPADRLDRLTQDVLDALHAVRTALEVVADRHGIKPAQVDQVMRGYITDALSDLTYETRTNLAEEIDRAQQAG